MSTKFSESFKKQAVEKALTRKMGITIRDVAQSLEIGYSTLNKWIGQFSKTRVGNSTMANQEKCPQDWRPEEKLEAIKITASLDEEALNAYCRKHGLYAHHIEQWKQEFIQLMSSSKTTDKASKSETKELKHEVKDLKRELKRKEKALSETAALLVLQKKVHAIWGDNEDD